jgi:cytochrome c-type biogenesis protein CcmH/NrfF
VRRAGAIALALLLIAGPAADVAAAACGKPRTSLADVEDEVMCPVCGVPLELATEAPQANRERAFIEREVAACKGKQEIKDELVAQFGDRVLALPPDEGFDLAAYLAPAAAALAGIAAIGTLAARRRSSGSREAATAGGALNAEDSARLEADLQRYEL